jgi:formate hydrogenlyase subunit 3/multisubunit Na+/H+ antiporter MnhD subunit
MLGGGVASLLLSRSRSWSSRVGATAVVTGGALELCAAVSVLSTGRNATLTHAWNVPYGAIALNLDPLAAFFLLPLTVLAASAAVYGVRYLAGEGKGRALGPHWFHFNLLVAAMSTVLVARHAVLFLVAWEVMSLAAFFLVTFDDAHEEVRAAGWTYLVATHIGTVFLLAMFVVLGRAAGSFDFEQMRAAALAGTPVATAVFVLSLVGFGTKAGFFGLHVWLPEAHPAAPSHVSAVMSGVMLKMGIFGLIEVLTLLGPPRAWWGGVLVGVGVASGILGVLFALAQHDLKRLLAYHSVENIGIITTGLGLGVLGTSLSLPVVAAAGFAGALLHVLNHALFKGLLFLGAGAVAHATGSRHLDRQGGLLKRMPWTGGTFLVGAAAISGLPPLNGFVSELLIYLAALAAALGPRGALIAALATITGLALIGGLALACFAKAFGVVFLGEPRSAGARDAREVGAPMRGPMVLLAAACAAVALAAPVAIDAVRPAVVELVGALGLDASAAALAGARATVTVVVWVFAAVLAGSALLLAVRRSVLQRRTVARECTWDCGYALPSPRMQYTASSFAQPLVDLFAPVLRSERHGGAPTGLFPARAAASSHTDDVIARRLFLPLFAALGGWLGRLRWLQQGRVQVYVLYVALTLLALLIWKVGL